LYDKVFDYIKVKYGDRLLSAYYENGGEWRLVYFVIYKIKRGVANPPFFVTDVSNSPKSPC
jgi:hypothetical protein